MNIDQGVPNRQNEYLFLSVGYTKIANNSVCPIRQYIDCVYMELNPALDKRF